MKCTVCRRELAPTLSICYACGTMVNDSVREELATKIGRVSKPLDIRIAVEADRMMAVAAVSEQPQPALAVAVPNPRPAPRQRRSDPTERINRHTSQTLVEFQNKNSNVPDWRIQLKNAIQQRKTEVDADPAPAAFPAPVTTVGQPKPKVKAAAETETVSHSNPKVAQALKRIEESRRKFSNAAAGRKPEATATPPAKNYPFNVVSRSEEVLPRPAARPATVNSLPKPRLVATAPAVEPALVERSGYDTNKLPPLPEAAPMPAPVEIIESEPAAELTRKAEPKKIEFRRTEVEPEPVEEVFAERNYAEEEEVDDLASLSSRFTAGVFDVIIGGFATAIVMSPVLVRGGDWFSVLGVLAIAATFGVVMFTYLTIAIGLRGRTVGMKIFSLEVIDIEANEYPTFHQAAVSSAVYLLSLPLLGVGFLPALFNEERRAAHDLVSGTLLVREV